MYSTARVALLVPLSLALTLAACGGDPSDRKAAWSATIAFQAETKLGGCAVGDLDERHPGNEIVAVGADGRVYVTRPTTEGWTTETVATLPGEMIQCAIGDADPTRPGNELVVVGMKAGAEDAGGKGAVHLVYRDGDGWATEEMFEDEALVHGVGIGDLDRHRDGDEVVVTGFSRKTTMLTRDAGAWQARSSKVLAGAGKNVLMLAGIALVANTSNTLVGLEVLGAGEPPRESQRLALGASTARVGRGADHIVAACDDGSLRLTDFHEVAVIHQEEQRLRGAVLGDLDPVVEGEEAATVGYGKELTVLYRGADWREPWTPVTLWRDTGALHHLAAGELRAESPGPELVAVGYSGNVIVTSRGSRDAP